MDNLKVSANSFNRVNPGQKLEKPRDESFLSSHLESIKDKNNNAVAARESRLEHMQELKEDRSRILAEQRQQEHIQQQAAKEREDARQQRAEELSQQRRIESRAAANRQKLQGAYNSVQQNNARQAANEEVREQASSTNSDQTNPPEAINLVV